MHILHTIHIVFGNEAAMKKNWTLGIIIIIALFIVACSSKTDSTDESKKSSEKEGYSVASDSSPSPTPFTPEASAITNSRCGWWTASRKTAGA